jgi:hypothetical protein
MPRNNARHCVRSKSQASNHARAASAERVGANRHGSLLPGTSTSPFLQRMLVACTLVFLIATSHATDGSAGEKQGELARVEDVDGLVKFLESADIRKNPVHTY